MKSHFALLLLSVIAIFAGLSHSRLDELDSTSFEDWISLELKKGSITAGYYTYSEQITLLDRWMLEYPNIIIKKETIGNSTAGNLGIVAYRLTYNPDNEDPSDIRDRHTAMVTAMHSGQELMAGDMAIYLIADLIYGAHKNEEKTMNLLRAYDIWVVPCVNPDALRAVEINAVAEQRIQIIRKNRRNDPSLFSQCADTSIGVSLMNNYDHAWSSSTGSSGEPCSNSYRGTSPASESETLAIQDFVEEKEPKIAINLMGGANQVLIPFSCCADQEYVHDYQKKIYDQLASSQRSPKSGFGRYGEVEGTKLHAGNPVDYMLMQEVIAVNQFIGHPDKPTEYSLSHHDERMQALANNIVFTKELIGRAGVELILERNSDISCHTCTNNKCGANALECDLILELKNVGLGGIPNGDSLELQIYFTDGHYELYSAWTSTQQLSVRTANVVTTDGNTYRASRVTLGALDSFELHRLAFTFNEEHWTAQEKDQVLTSGRLPEFVIEVLPTDSEYYFNYSEHLTGLVATFRYQDIPDNYFGDQPTGLEEKDDTKHYFAGFWVFTAIFAVLVAVGKCCMMRSSEEALRNGAPKAAKGEKKPKSTRDERFTKPGENVATDAGMLETDR